MGEGATAAQARARAALAALAAQLHDGETGAWVSHSKFLRVLLREVVEQQPPVASAARATGGGDAGGRSDGDAAPAAAASSTTGDGYWRRGFPEGFRLGNTCINVVDVDLRALGGDRNSGGGGGGAEEGRLFVPAVLRVANDCRHLEPPSVAVAGELAGALPSSVLRSGSAR